MGFIQKLNGPWHERALWIYLAIVVLHWIEHLFQAAQIWILEMPRPEALGALGYVFPWLVKSEVMHFGYALIMFTGLVLLLPGFRGASHGWWLASTIIQGWHLIEHSTLQIQAIVGTNLFGSPVPTSFLQPFGPPPGTAPRLQPDRLRPDDRGDVVARRPSRTLSTIELRRPTGRASQAGLASVDLRPAGRRDRRRLGTEPRQRLRVAGPADPVSAVDHEERDPIDPVLASLDHVDAHRV